MKKNNICFAVILIVLLILAGCGKEKEISAPAKNIEETEALNDRNKNAIPEVKNPDTNNTVEEDDPSKVVSPLDGLKYSKDELSKRVIAVSIDNHPGARWQAGLKDAEIIYELEVEYPFTRYLCIYLAHEPEMVGPVRSVRPYLVYFALEYDSIFAHVGGSEAAFSEIKRLGCADIDGLYSGSMYRYYKTGKSAPHNVYTTLKLLRDEASRYGYRMEGKFEPYKFNEKQVKLSESFKAAKAGTIKINYNKENTTGYTYDEEQKIYLRFKDGSPHVDELDDSQLKAKNIIVIEASKYVLDSSGRLELGIIGSGKGKYFTMGESTDITWEKQSEKEKMKFYIGKEELSLNPGNTWIQVVSTLAGVASE
jgi:hypothetical protein